MTGTDAGQMVLPPSAEEVAAVLAEYVDADHAHQAAMKRLTVARTDLVAVLRAAGVRGVTL